MLHDVSIIPELIITPQACFATACLALSLLCAKVVKQRSAATCGRRESGELRSPPYGGFHKWGNPHSWMVYNGKSH